MKMVTVRIVKTMIDIVMFVLIGLPIGLALWMLVILLGKVLWSTFNE